MRDRMNSRKNRKCGRVLYTGAALMLACLLGGCGGDFPQLSDEQMDAAGEYAANLLLKYDSDYRRRLMTLEEMEKESQKRAAWAVKPPAEEGTQEQQPVEIIPQPGDNTGGLPDTGIKYGTLEDYFAFPDGVDIRYTGYRVCNSYPEDQSSFFSLDASAGKDILAIEFELSNQGEAAQTIDLMNRKGSYRITVNGSYSRSQLTTLLDNDMATFQGRVLPGEVQQLVLLAEIDEGMEVSTLTIRLKNDAIESTIQLK